jgi:hypothetical protein
MGSKKIVKSKGKIKIKILKDDLDERRRADQTESNP